MPKAVERFLAWSFSRLSDWRRCPRQAAWKHIKKKPTKGNPAMARGSEVHSYLQGVANDKPARRREFKWAAGEIHKALGEDREYDTEMQWAFDKNWKRVEWFDKSAWVRMVLDLAVYEDDRALIVDYKTGRVKKEDHKEQLWLYALGAFLEDADLKQVTVEIWYVDHQDTLREVFRRNQLKELKAYWKKQVKGMMADRRFVPRPGNYCRWCDFSKKKGGECEY